MRKDSVQITRSRVAVAKTEDGGRPCGICLDSVQVEGVFEAPETQPAAPPAEAEAALTEVKRPALVEVNITSRRLVLYKGKP